MPRKRDVNLSHCGNAISRMWSPFGCGVKRSIDAAGNAASEHKMFIAAGSDFSGGKVRGEKRVAETQIAARMGGGGYHKVYLKMDTVLSGEPCDIFPDVINASVYLVDHLIMPETDNMPT